MPKFAAPQNRRELLQLAQEAGVRYIRLIFADILGQSKNVVIPLSRLDDALDGQVTFDGGSIDGFVRDQEIDMILRPDVSTFALLPMGEQGAREARMICDLVMPDGKAFEGCPRTTLRRVLDATSESVPALTAALEVEFYLFTTIDSELPRTDDVNTYFGYSVSDRGELVRSSIVEALESMGIDIAASHHEHGAGQHEIDFVATSVLEAADQLLTLRMIAKQIAARHGMHATFMPKPLETSAGSGLHLYFAWGRDTNETRIATHVGHEPPLPESPEDPSQFALEEERDLDAQELHAVLNNFETTPEEYLFGIGGLLTHASACTAICNPTINSYKRLVAAWDAPIYALWSHRSANALVRVPHVHRNTRIEMRSPDPSCNPYLALAVLVASIVDGLHRRILPGEAWTGSAYTINEQERIERGIQILPRSLREAIDCLDEDIVVRHAIGDHIYHSFCDAKMLEYEQYRRTVHPWERNAYLRAY